MLAHVDMDAAPMLAQVCVYVSVYSLFHMKKRPAAIYLPAPSKKHATTDTSERYVSLMYLGRPSHVSKSGIAALLHQVKDDRPEALSRSTQYRARKSCCSLDTPYGPLVREETFLAAQQSQRSRCPTGNQHWLSKPVGVFYTTTS